MLCSSYSPWREKSLIKIPRAQTQQVLAEVEAVAGDNQRLRELFESVLAVAEAYKNEMQVEARIERVKMNVAAGPSASVATFDSASSRARNLYIWSFAKRSFESVRFLTTNIVGSIVMSSRICF